LLIRMSRVAAGYGIAQLQAKIIKVSIFFPVAGELCFIRGATDIFVSLVEEDNAVVR
jgi:hypothetical protein